MKVGFLFGAGVSIPCGAPTTNRLTDMVLAGEGVQRHSDGTFFVSSESYGDGYYQELVPRIREFVTFLKSHSEKFFSNQGRIPNYEDLYYLSTQLTDAVVEYENPALLDFLRKARKFASRKFDLYRETTQYIKGIVVDALSTLRPAENHLQQVIEATSDRSVSEVEIFTLNYDRLIERSLEQASVPFTDGFACYSNELRCWKHGEFTMNPSRVRLYKLHGSIHWHHVRFCDGCWRVCIATNNDVWHAHGPCDDLVSNVEPHAMLMGTFNKMLEYTMGIYADLFCAFRKALRSLNRLVISGYSFSDKGVNASIAEWTRQDFERRVLIIAPDASQYKDTARGAIRRLIKDCGNRITTFDRGFEKVPWKEVREWIGTRV